MRRFPETHAEGGPRPSVCIVTSELIGPFNNGGIGTSMTGLAHCLAKAGFPVTLLYTGGKLSAPAELARWRARYAECGIALHWIRHEEGGRLLGPVADCGFVAPWLVYEWLVERHFDVVQFNDCMGEGFYCLAARRLGTAFQDTALFVGLHSPSQWIFEINRMLPTPLLFAAFNHAERLTTRTADLLWSPSEYLLGWARGRGFALPEETYLQRYVMPPVPLFGDAPKAPARPAPTRLLPREIVFFARLEERKGLRIFCEALRLIEPVLAQKGIAVTFLGKIGTLGDRPAIDYLESEGRDRPFPWKLETDLGQPEAIAYLRSREALAVIASPADNSPCTVYEALTCGIPFIAARTGGIPELIAQADREKVLFDCNAQALASALTAAIADGVAPPAPAEEQREIARRWVGAFENPRTNRAADPRPALRPVVALVDGRDGADASETIRSLDGPDVDKIVLIDRGGPRPAAAPGKLVTIPAEAMGGLPALLESASPGALLLVRSGVVLLPGAAARLAEALRAEEPDGLVPAVAVGQGEADRILPPLGGSPSFCFYEGALPGGVIALKAERLAAAVEASTLPADSEHFGLADLAVAAGLELWPLAEVLARHPDGLVEESGNRRAPERAAAYASTPSRTERYYIAAIGFGRAQSPAGIAPRLRRLREWAARRGYGWAVRAAYRIVPRSIVRRLAKHG